MSEWQPIETAPRDGGETGILIAEIVNGEVVALDYDAIWASDYESWEMPQVYWYWASANGSVEEPTHWSPMPAMPKPKAAEEVKQSCAYCNKLIKPGQPTVPDEFGEPGARMHIGCAAADQDGQDLDRDHGDT